VRVELFLLLTQPLQAAREQLLRAILGRNRAGVGRVVVDKSEARAVFDAVASS
jgi:hypothetical protein